MTDYKLVPVEPTDEMATAAMNAEIHANSVYGEPAAFSDIWRAMLSAAPAVQGEPVAYLFHDEIGRTKIVLGIKTAELLCPPYESITPLYTAPQPAPQPLTDEHKVILKECRNQAMRWTLDARIPEAGAFGGIAQDLDYLCAQLGVKNKPTTAPQPAEQQPCPEDIRGGAPYDDPAFESLCREHEIWGTAAAAQCAVFWEAGKRVAEQQPAPDVEALVNDAERWRYVRQFLSLDDVGDEEFCLGLVVDCEGLESAVTTHAARLYAERCANEWVVDADYVGDISPLPPVTVEQAIDAAMEEPSHDNQ